MAKLNRANSGLTLLVFLLLFSLGCKLNKQVDKKVAKQKPAVQSLSFAYQTITGIGLDSLYNRRDNSDIIKVGNTYYVWYTRMDSPVTSGYWGTIWYATSTDEGFTWKEQGMALDLGEKGAFDSHSVFTPNILVKNGKYYLYYTGVKPTEGNVNNEFEGNSTNDFTAIGLAVADGPNGPFVRVKDNPVLSISERAEDFDSYRVDDASLLHKEGKVWFYYKGRSMSHGKEGPKLTQMGVATADKPEGPFVKNSEPILDKSHEVLIWAEDGGVSSLASFSQSIYSAAEGLNFSPLYQNLENIPKAPGLYRPSLTNSSKSDAENWGVAMVQKNRQTYLVRFEMKID
ncbi:family 43 glycosylhydrolase [uncultured Arcticibacterium sp.]|uniref:family 43 glycosylhydrolase n=1 Tax=uncultured Arcticibacterium sp. TaxID=2173042 RepID=UPI0030FA31C3